jgi:Putative sensor
MLGIPVPFTFRTSSPLRLRDRLLAQLRDPYAWRALLYLLLKFPFGLVALVLMVGLIGTALFCMFVPIGYTTGMFSDDLIILDFDVWSYKVNSIQRSLTVAFAGLILAAISFPILNLLAHWWGRFARVMLSNAAELEPASNLERPLKARPE